MTQSWTSQQSSRTRPGPRNRAPSTTLETTCIPAQPPTRQWQTASTSGCFGVPRSDREGDEDLAHDGMTDGQCNPRDRFRREVADEMWFMNKGAIIEREPPSAVLSNAQQPSLWEFLA